MAVKKYFADADNTITNAFKADLTTRGTDANMGQSDVLETFSIYGQASSGSTELERILIKFPMTDIISDRSNNLIPVSGSATFYLRLYNAKHNQTVPRDLTLNVYAVSRSWQEGIGLDMDNYTDVVYPGNIGSTWMSASSTEAWTRMGGDYHDSPQYSAFFDRGYEDLKIDVTSLVEEWIAGTKDNDGFGIHLTASQEAYFSGTAGADSSDGELNNLVGAQTSYYTKKFFGRGTEFYYKRPSIEVVWDSSIKDDRGRLHVSSSLLPEEDNTYTLYLYNIFGGRLRDFPTVGTGEIYVQMYNYTNTTTPYLPTAVTGGWVSTGIYSASFECSGALFAAEADDVNDRWWVDGTQPDLGTEDNILFSGRTGVILDYSLPAYTTYNALAPMHPGNLQYVSNITNLKPTYAPTDNVRLRVYTRLKNWSPTVYTVANELAESSIIVSASYQIYRVIDDLPIIPYDTSSAQSTAMSYDIAGNYFDLDMGYLEPGYSYGIKIAFYNENSYVEQPYTWKFRVDELDDY